MTGGSRLGYQTKKDGQTIGLLRRPSMEPWSEFTCLNSLREVEPTANLILNDHGLDDDDNGLGSCRGRRPHLVDYVDGGCKDIDGSEMRQVAMLQGASNSWFAIMLSALAIPKAVDLLSQLIEDQWTTLRQAQSQQNIEVKESFSTSQKIRFGNG